MDVVVIVNWNFTPPDYFERDFTVAHEGHQLNVSQGKVEARIDPAVYDGDVGLRGRLHTALNDRFLGVQLVTHKPYTLDDPTLIRVDDGGKRHHYVELRGIVMTAMGGSVDFTVSDKDGNVVIDTKKDRIDRKLSLAELISKHRSADATLATALRAHDAAVREADHELVHLYEIRDTLKTRFGNDGAARTALGMTDAKWRRFGQLCNYEPLRQGRHNGLHGNILRDATDAELVEARGIAMEMIDAYLHILELPPQQPTNA